MKKDLDISYLFKKYFCLIFLIFFLQFCRCVKKLYEIFCCDNKCCDCCFGSEKKLIKLDIQYFFRELFVRLDLISFVVESM